MTDAMRATTGTAATGGETAHVLDAGGGRPDALAFRTRDGRGPRLVWLGGYGSDMTGTKAEALSAFAGGRGQAFLRLDYSGHGASGGRFIDGTVSRWTRDAGEVIAAAAAPGEALVLVGSSMGAWIALRLALGWRAAGAAAPRLAGLLLVAPAPDFTGRLIEPSLGAAERAALERGGFFAVPSPYGPEPTIYTRALLEDGRASAVMAAGPLRLDCPIRILQGMEDPDVPFGHALDLATLLPFDDLVVTLVRGGDHRLSRPADIERLLALAGELSDPPPAGRS